MATAIAANLVREWIKKLGPQLLQLGKQWGPRFAALEGFGEPDAAVQPDIVITKERPVAPVAPAPPVYGPDNPEPGIAIPQSAPVYASDLPAAPASPRFQPAPSRFVPVAPKPFSSRYSGAAVRPEFIYTNPAAAAQAGSNYASRLGYEAQQDQGYRDYLARLEAERGASDRANVQGQSYGNQLQATSQEGAANRASAERISAMSAAEQNYRYAENQWARNELNADMGEGYADTLNKDPAAKVDRRYVRLNPETGRWESIFKRSVRPVPPSLQTLGPAAPVPEMITPAWPGASPVPIAAAPAPVGIGIPAPLPPAPDNRPWHERVIARGLDKVGYAYDPSHDGTETFDARGLPIQVAPVAPSGEEIIRRGPMFTPPLEIPPNLRRIIDGGVLPVAPLY